MDLKRTSGSPSSTPKGAPTETSMPLRLGFFGLTALVFGMMVGGGIFDLPQNFARGAGLGAVAIAWLITAGGMLLLVATLKTLADRRPDLRAGIYQYALEGFGHYMGFNAAWGYWLCAAFANVTYAVMLNDSFGAFFPALLDHRVPTLIFGSVLIWTMYLLVAVGIRTAKYVNSFLAVLKVAVILLIIVLLVINARMGLFSFDFMGRLGDLGGLGHQVRSTMLVTLYCFIGIEGAVVMSSRAGNVRHVGRAGVIGFFMAWTLYVLVSMLSYGVMTRAQLAGLENPSVAYVLRTVCGDWAYYFVIISVIVSLLGGWLSWTIVTAQVPMEAAAIGVFPRPFMRLNTKGMPAGGLAVSSVIMQLFLVIVVTADNVYITALNITGMMILPAYLFCGLYLWKVTCRPSELGNPSRKDLLRFRFAGVACTLYCLWMLYSASLSLLLLTSLFYIAGVPMYVRVRRGCPGPVFTRGEKWAVAVMAVCAAVSVAMLINNPRLGM